VSVKDRAVLTPMTILEFCTDRMSGFMGSVKPSSFCNYFVEPHLPASCSAFTFRGRMRLSAKTSSWEQGLVNDFHTREPPEVKRMSCWSGSSPAGCVSIRVAATFSVMSGSLSLQSSRSILAYC
jgi:hypothetical protein